MRDIYVSLFANELGGPNLCLYLSIYLFFPVFIHAFIYFYLIYFLAP